MSATPAELVERLAENGVRLWTDGRKLRLASLKLTPETVEALRASKPELLRVLRGGCDGCRAALARGVSVLMCSCGYREPFSHRFAHEYSGWDGPRIERQRRGFSKAERGIWVEEYCSIREAHPDLSEIEAGRRASALIERCRRSGYFER